MDKGIIIFSLILILLVVAYNFGFLKQPKIVNGNVLPGNIFVDGRFYNFRNNMKIPEIFEINGSAKGNWFFEASLPITIEDEQGNVLETFTAQAQEDWMTKDYVEFNAKINISKLNLSSGQKIFLVFNKDNPSGDPKLEDSEKFQVIVK
ncbi:MAG TPA: Gmad2 immunoglobulin-like domain-containing protein [Candidatus Pacearchaeota archaeon]|nr:hypothetical protein [Candidatus Parcubacteria bacterium]HNZ83769.1 Gmad2 immunoglobulin-like domain-containing protein [Candidatus Pacearchaeota archaeon]HOU45966.1 Gmad2 immunoglobulin-like domain-containing protein [Candidatus Pacearchaeota archaeon]HPM08748.1 Gmad2 immunoglobulin-like domain-containing protein [Candidatus Pacearchaeota archaeon]HQI74635.1 Gmad2 immunoglobulin-like domain-containing protein [Candidatus Pacearchaeota archaeon]